MQHRPTASVGVPHLTGTTEAFRIGDVKSGTKGFLDGLATVLSGLPPPDAFPSFDAADLRIQSLDEAIKTTVGSSSSPSTTAQTQNPELPSTSLAAATAAVAAPQSQAPLSTQQERQQAIDAYNTAVATVREKYEKERETAAQHLRSLQQLPIDGDRRYKRSFDDFIEAVEPVTARNMPEAPVIAPPEGGEGVVPDGEVVVRVAVHLPQAPAYCSEEWLVLGSQRLTELKDVLYCLMERNLKNVQQAENEKRLKSSSNGGSSIGGGEGTTLETSAAAAAPPPLASFDKPSSYFYIEGTFFVDTRISGAGDISEGIRKYLVENEMRAPLHPPPGTVARPLAAPISVYSLDVMQDRKFEDLWVRLGSGSPGLYCHQGGCEHLIIFQDVRRHDAGVDPPLLSQYPFKVANPGAEMAQKRHCEACGLRIARKVTHHDRMVPMTPFFWCEDCFTSLHYNAQGQLLYTDFQVFPYVGDYLPAVLHEKKAS